MLKLATIPHRIFLSSTFSDLINYRQTVQDAIRQLGVVDVSMENFGARDERPVRECIRLVKQQSDIFIGIYAHRYGHCPDGSTKSILEMEYEAASEANLPRFIYIIDDDQPWVPTHIDQGKNAYKLRAFKDALFKRHICARFKGQDQLATKVVTDLGRHIATKGLTYIDPYDLPFSGFSVSGDDPEWDKPGRLRGWFDSANKYLREYLRLPVIENRFEWYHRLNSLREAKRDVFLTHFLEPSSIPGQQFDVFIYLIRNQSENFSDVRFAEFFMGHHWQCNIFTAVEKNGFIGVKTAAYGTFLCICRVTFRVGSTARLDRYIDFESQRTGGRGV